MVRHVVERRAQAAVIVIFQRNESEWLQDASAGFFRWAQQFGHSVYGAGLRLERDFDKIALSERGRQLQQAASRRNGLQFSFCAPAIF